jgi:regulator of sigma E protease
MFVGILIFFFILFSLVIIHEFGHYYAAKKSGVRVEEFGFGLPPRIFGRKFGKAPEKGEDDRTLFSLNLLPIGGFVRMTGEDATLVDSDPKNFQNAKLWKRMWIVLSGVAMNFVLGILLFSIVYTHIGIPANPARFDVTINEVSVDSPAATAGLVAGDKIVGINDTVVTSADVLTKEITENFDKTVSLKIERNGEQKTFEVFARAKENRPENQGALGVGLGEKLVTTRAEWYKMPFLGAVQGLKDTYALAKSIVPALGDLVSTLVLKQQVPAGVSGPAGIAKASFMFCNEFYSCLQFAGLLSVNLAVFNLLPLPALDGGRFFFMLVEAVTRKKVNPKFEQWVHSIGMILLLILILIVTYNDIFTKNPLIK